MVVKEIMKKNIVKVPLTATVTEVAKIMAKNNIGSVLVNEGEKIVGIMTERDILKRVVAEGKNCEDKLAKDIMTTSLITVDLESSLDHANEMMAKHKIRRLIVTEKDNIAGIITIRDVAAKLKYSLAKRLLGNPTEHFRPIYYDKSKK